MAIKVPVQKEVKESSELTVPVSNALAPFAAANMFDVEPPKPTGNMFPQVKIPYPIEMNETFPAETLYKLGLFDGSKFALVAAPYILTVIACREASRKPKIGPDGNYVVNEKGRTQFDRAYKSMGTGYDKSQELFIMHAADPAAEKGVTYIVGIIGADGSVAVAELQAFKTLKDYWGGPLYQARKDNGLGLKVKIENHSVNLVQSKKPPKPGTPPGMYLAPKKFTQHEVVELSPDQVQCVNAVLEQNVDKFKAWAEQ